MTSSGHWGRQVAVDTGLHVIVITDILTGCTDTLTLHVNCIDCPELYTGPTTIELADCADLAEICLDLDLMDLPDGYSIQDNGDPYQEIWSLVQWIHSCPTITSLW